MPFSRSDLGLDDSIFNCILALTKHFNPNTLFPSGSGILTRDGMFSSGIMDPVPGTTYTITIGDMTPGLQPFLCLLHDTSGMKGELMVVPKH